MILEIVLFSAYIILPLLAYYQVIPVKYRWYMFLTASAFASLLVIFRGYSLTDLGIRFDNLAQADGYYYILFFLAFGFCAYFKQHEYTLGYKKLLGKHITSFKGLWFVPAQEFLYRSVPLPLLSKLGLHPFLIIAIMTILFGFAHVPFRSAKIFGMTTMLGFILSGVYVFLPNFFLVTILHMVVWVTGVHFKII